MSHTLMEKAFADYFDPELSMIQVSFDGPGYHSRVPAGTRVHDIRASFAYALDLVCQHEPSATARAVSILERVLPLQDRDSVSPTYGIWSWLYEEPLSQMDPPDWNWADFCGFRLAQILYKSANRLPEALLADARTALSHAAGSIYRRNMGPHYTNISIMGGLVTAMAGECLAEARMLDYGRRRLKQSVDHFSQQGGFNEYNSPTYTWVVLKDCELALDCLRDPEASRLAAELHRCAWEVLAHHFHPATGQWAGPHSRAYHPFVQPEVAEEIRELTGVDIPSSPHVLRKEFQSISRLGGPACPADLVPRFQALPQSEYTIEEVFIKASNDEASTCGTTWFHDEACLGSVNHDHFWDQHRAVLGYWNGAAGTPVALRLRFLKDEKEFCSAYVRNRQFGPRVLSAAHLLLGRGDWHPVWGAAEGDVFAASDLRLRYELRGDDVQARELEGGGCLLWSGEWGAVLSPSPSSFDGEPVDWCISSGDGWVAFDAIAYAGESKSHPFRELGPTYFGVGMELRKVDGIEVAEEIATELSPEGGLVTFSYSGLRVASPLKATPLPS